MNVRNFSKSCELLGPNITNELLDLKCIVTEKIHGENFRVGVTETGDPFIGQRNQIFYVMYTGDISEPTWVGQSAHPNWNKLTSAARNKIDKLLGVCVMKFEETGTGFVFFGELCGNGLKTGFTYPWDGLSVLYFDVLFKERDEDAHYLAHRDAYYWMDYFNVPRVPVVATQNTIREALALDVEAMKSEVTGDGFIEGVVIKPVDRLLVNAIWHSDHRLIIKHKTERYSEEAHRKVKVTVADINSPFCEFVTIARIEHAIEKIEENGNPIEYEMKDMQYIRNEVVQDIEREENNGYPLTPEDNKALNKFIPKVYAELLREKTNAAFGII